MERLQRFLMSEVNTKNSIFPPGSVWIVVSSQADTGGKIHEAAYIWDFADENIWITSAPGPQKQKTKTKYKKR